MQQSRVFVRGSAAHMRTLADTWVWWEGARFVRVRRRGCSTARQRGEAASSSARTWKSSLCRCTTLSERVMPSSRQKLLMPCLQHDHLSASAGCSTAM